MAPDVAPPVRLELLLLTRDGRLANAPGLTCTVELV
jgi:hypothetical protein